jgi:hypothetical protein
MPKTDVEKEIKREEKRMAKALRRKDKKITKSMVKRKKHITEQQLKARDTNFNKTNDLISIIKSLNAQQNEDFREIKQLKQEIRIIEKRRREREIRMWNTEMKELKELNPGSCQECGLFGGHEPYGCEDGDCDGDDSSCEEYEVSTDNDIAPMILRWQKEPTDEYVRHVYEKLYYSDCD